MELEGQYKVTDEYLENAGGMPNIYMLQCCISWQKCSIILLCFTAEMDCLAFL
jgi:hypothetical protein